MDQRYHTRIAEAYVRGHCLRQGLPVPEDCITYGQEQGLKMHYFKVKEDLPRVQVVLGFLRGIQFDSLLDVGSGAGFPGLPLKMAEPSIRLTLLDAQRKRVDFLRDVCRETGLADVECVQFRVEEYVRMRRETFDVVISRAVASLPVLTELCLPLVRTGGHMLAMKSVHCDEELKQTEHAFSILGGTLEQVTDYRVPGTEVVHRLIVIRKTGETPVRYPRPFRQMKKKPL